MYFTFSIKWKTENELRIHLLQMLAAENEYIYDSFVVILSQKRQTVNLKKLSLI